MCLYVISLSAHSYYMKIIQLSFQANENEIIIIRIVTDNITQTYQIF